MIVDEERTEHQLVMLSKVKTQESFSAVMVMKVVMMMMMMMMMMMGNGDGSDVGDDGRKSVIRIDRKAES